MKQAVITFDQKPAGDVALDDAIFGCEPRSDILARVVHWQQTKARAGTHKTKGVSEISGTGKKPWKQKGNGRARQGSLRSPQFRGGAVIFGPVVRDHGYSLNKKIRKLGLKMALSAKIKAGAFLVLDALPETAKTGIVASQLQAANLKHVLFITAGTAEQHHDTFARAIANVPNTDILPVAGANVLSILRRKTLVLTREGVKQLEERLK